MSATSSSPPTYYVPLSEGNSEVRRVKDKKLIGYVSRTKMGIWKAKPFGGDPLPQDAWTRHTARQVLVAHWKKMEGFI